MLLRAFGIGGGTALPGLLVEKYFPKIVSKLSRQIPDIYLVSGTNGKTTTQRLLTHILTSLNYKVISNPGGGNLLRGIASALITNTGWNGKIKSQYAVFEVEEATMPILTKLIDPKLIILTNLFRDQLDAYGGIHKIQHDLKKSIDQTDAAVLINGNDPKLIDLSKQLKNAVYNIKLDDKSVNEFKFEGVKVNTESKELLKAEITRVNDDLSVDFVVNNKEFHQDIPGIYNVFNTLLAIGAVKLISNNEPSDLIDAVKSFKPPWGRGEVIQIRDKSIRIILIKNPAGFSITLKTLAHISNINLLIAINDNIADGRDISWLWDVDNLLFEKLKCKKIYISGTRAADMMVRLKYTNSDLHNLNINDNLEKTIDHALSELENNNTLFILPTYTALLDIRKIINEKYSTLDKFWEA